MIGFEHSAAAWLDYTVQAGQAAGLSAAYVGQTFADNANTLVNPGYTLFDAALRYDLGASNPSLKGSSVSINALNLVDEKSAICNDGYCYPSQGRTVLGSLRYRW